MTIQELETTVAEAKAASMQAEKEFRALSRLAALETPRKPDTEGFGVPQFRTSISDADDERFLNPEAREFNEKRKAARKKAENAFAVWQSLKRQLEDAEKWKMVENIWRCEDHG
jgi:hypothetical protein